MGILTLIPTPLSDENSLAPEVKLILEKAISNNGLIIQEDRRSACRRWVSWGLPREAIDSFIYLNEHTYKKNTQEIFEKISQGQKAYLLSDCGLPAFMDPGRELVDACHRHAIPVTSAPFYNSFSLALALSGFPHEKVIFEGRPPRKPFERKIFMDNIIKEERTLILMDAPYRLKTLLEDLAPSSREIFCARSLGTSSEKLNRGPAKTLLKKLKFEKVPFVLVVAPKGKWRG